MMKNNAILAFAVVAILIFSFGCAQQQPPAPQPTPVPMPGSDRDAHGCIPSAGYTWCADLNKCIRPWETNCTFDSADGTGDDMMPGSDRDAHGCIGSAGYSWCSAKQKCIRSWEENCTAAVSAKSDVRLITENFPPFNFAGKDGTAKGRSTAIVRGILSRLGQSADIEILPWAEGYNLALNTKNVALFSTARTLSRDPLFKWVGPIGTYEKALYVKANSTLAISNLDSARKAGSICVVKDDARQQMLAERGFTNLRISVSDEKCITDLVSGKTDVWFGSTDSEPFSAYLAGVDPDALKMAYVVESNEIFIAFSNSTPDATVQAWQSALDKMKLDGFYDALQGQYKITAPDSAGREIAATGGISLAAFESLVNGKIDGITSGLQAAASAQSALSGSWSKISPTLSALAGKYNYTLFWYALPNGTYYLVNEGLAPSSLSDRTYFKEVMAGKVSIGTLVTSKSTGKNAVVAAVPIKNGMVTVGALGGTTYLDSLSNEVGAALALPDYMYFFAINNDSQVALHTDTYRIMQYPSTFGGQSIADAMGTMVSTNNGTLDYTLDGRPRRAVYGTSSPTNWHFAIAEYLE
jgi:polar amino acid transport system substrate-binding protein